MGATTLENEWSPTVVAEMFPDDEEDGIQNPGSFSVPQISGPASRSFSEAPTDSGESTTQQFSEEKNFNEGDSEQVGRLLPPSHTDTESAESLDSDLTRQTRLDLRVRRSSRLASRREAS